MAKSSRYWCIKYLSFFVDRERGYYERPYINPVAFILTSRHFFTFWLQFSVYRVARPSQASKVVGGFPAKTCSFWEIKLTVHLESMIRSQFRNFFTVVKYTTPQFIGKVKSDSNFLKIIWKRQQWLFHSQNRAAISWSQKGGFSEIYH